MTDYTSIKVSKELHRQMREDKPDGVSWEYYLRNVWKTSEYVEEGN